MLGYITTSIIIIMVSTMALLVIPYSDVSAFRQQVRRCSNNYGLRHFQNIIADDEKPGGLDMGSRGPVPPSEPTPEEYESFDIVRATQYGLYDRCTRLIVEGFDVNQLDAENVSLLHWAAINNRTDLVRCGGRPNDLDVAKKQKPEEEHNVQ